ncbi:XRE family transcriptional regulator [Kitasatospora acidiphila]|uniref:XRE family transcriptional regulator n=1 Tax=Kitasatospora acidiphila TaxID=2567942 RepID=A0A540W746_9ACTN|nr:XRE family transcriptional regulator [Kitasatospora acidiphila]
MSRLHRKRNGQPLRDAMKAGGWSIPKLAEATKTVDPLGRGVSRSAVGVLVTQGSSARKRCRIRTAWLIADALGQPLQDLFDMPGASTSTEERSIADDRQHAAGPAA